MVRPERIAISVEEPTTLSTNGGSGTQSVRATVTDLTFQGPTVRLALRAPDDSPIIANIDPDADLPLLRPGDAVWATWSSSAVCVLPDAPNQPLTLDDIVVEN